MAKTDAVKQDRDSAAGIDSGKGLTRDELDTPLTFEEAWAEISDHGLSENDVVLVTNVYEPLGKNKDPLVAKPFVVRSVKFSADKVTGNPFVIMHCIDQQNNRWLLTDGSSGIYKQMDAQVAKRMEDGHPYPFNFYVVANGLRKSEFGIDANGSAVPLGDSMAVDRGATYYID